MEIRKVVRKRVRRTEPGLHVAADVDATVAANVGGRGGVTRVSSTQRITQRTGDRKDRT